MYMSGQHNQCTLKVHVFADFELAIHTHDVDDYFKTPTNKRCRIQRKQINSLSFIIIIISKMLNTNWK